MLIPVLGGIMGLIIPLLAALLQSSPNTLWLMICLGVFELIMFNFVAPRLISQSVQDSVAAGHRRDLDRLAVAWASGALSSPCPSRPWCTRSGL